MVSSYSPSLSFFTHGQNVDLVTSLHSLFSSALRKPGTVTYLLFALPSIYFLALSDCKTRVYEARIVFGIAEQDITQCVHWSNYELFSIVHASMMTMTRRESCIIYITSYVTIWVLAWFFEWVRSNASIPPHFLIMVIWIITYNISLRITVVFTGVPWRCHIGTRMYIHNLTHFGGLKFDL